MTPGQRDAWLGPRLSTDTAAWLRTLCRALLTDEMAFYPHVVVEGCPASDPPSHTMTAGLRSRVSRSGLGPPGSRPQARSTASGGLAVRRRPSGLGRGRGRCDQQYADSWVGKLAVIRPRRGCWGETGGPGAASQGRACGQAGLGGTVVRVAGPQLVLAEALFLGAGLLGHTGSGVRKDLPPKGHILGMGPESMADPARTRPHPPSRQPQGGRGSGTTRPCSGQAGPAPGAPAAGWGSRGCGQRRLSAAATLLAG